MLFRSEVAGPSTSAANTDAETLTLTGAGFHLTSFFIRGGTVITFPADHKFHDVKYEIAYTGDRKALGCVGHTTLKNEEGPGISNLKMGACGRNGSLSTTLRLRAYHPGRVTMNLYLCDVDSFVTYCNGRTRSTNSVPITLIITEA